MSSDIHKAGLLSVRETATMLGVTEKTVRRLIAAGRLPALQLGPPGSSIRIPADELDEWLNSEPAKTLAERLGHAKASMSLDVYTHTLDPGEVAIDELRVRVLKDAEIDRFAR
jgi:excisionase family DNA binding protein